MRGTRSAPIIGAVLAVVFSIVGPFSLRLALARAATRTATVEVENGVLEFRALPGERDNVGVNELPSTGSFVEVHFEGARVTAGPGCRLHDVDPRVFHCFAVTSLDLWMGDRPDEVYLFGEGPTIVHGGAGRDFLSGSGGSDKLIGGRGRDSIVGRSGGDTLLGGPGNDVLEGFHAGSLGGAPSGPDEDLLNGGPGRDFLFGGPASDRLVGGT